MTHSLTAKFEEFHATNPHVYRLLVRHAHEWRTLRGHQKIGVDMLVARIRWDPGVSTESAEYKIANAHRAFYARLIMWQETSLRGLFNVAASEADEWIAEIIRRHDAA